MRNRVIIGVICFCFILLSSAGYYIYQIYDFGNDIHESQRENTSRFSQLVETENTYTPPDWEGKERVNILLLGGDTRGLAENEVPRSDSMILVSIDPEQKTGHLFSILRDTYLEIPGYGSERINAALALGGPDLSMETVSEFLGLPVQYYVYVDFEGFIKLIDAIGGVDFYVEKDMKYIDITDKEEYQIDLKQGQQHLDGNKALQYVRFRHDALSDYSRTERQRAFLKAVADKLQSGYSLLRLPSILDEVKPYIETNMEVDTMLRLATLMYQIDVSTVEDLQIPPAELLREVETSSGAKVITADDEAVKQYVQDAIASEADVEDADPTVDETAGGGM